MQTGNKIMRTFTISRVALLAGVSAAALSLSMSAAQAQNVTITGLGTTGQGLSVDGNGNVIGAKNAAPATSIGATAANFSIATLSTDADNSHNAGLVAVVPGISRTTVTGTGLTVTDGSNTNSLTATGLNANIVVGATVTDGVATLQNGNLFNVINIQGVSTGNISGFVNVNATTGNFSTVNATTVNATTVNATTVNAGTVGAKMVNADQVNAGNLAVAPGGQVDMGGNVVHDVGTPIVGTDAANKAYVDTTVHKARQQAFEGTAVALAISQPVLLPGQTFAMRGGWGDFEGQTAAGFSAAGVVARDVLGYGSTLTLDAGVGVGSSFSGIGGKAGVTIGFGGTAPLK
jgi:hypothetical protein